VSIGSNEQRTGELPARARPIPSSVRPGLFARASRLPKIYSTQRPRPRQHNLLAPPRTSELQLEWLVCVGRVLLRNERVCNKSPPPNLIDAFRSCQAPTCSDLWRAAAGHCLGAASGRSSRDPPEWRPALRPARARPDRLRPAAAFHLVLRSGLRSEPRPASRSRRDSLSARRLCRPKRAAAVVLTSSCGRPALSPSELCGGESARECQFPRAAPRRNGMGSMRGRRRACWTQ
jgi:hypothetical protein